MTEWFVGSCTQAAGPAAFSGTEGYFAPGAADRLGGACAAALCSQIWMFNIHIYILYLYLFTYLFIDLSIYVYIFLSCYLG
jgi:hypothetical protein